MARTCPRCRTKVDSGRYLYCPACKARLRKKQPRKHMDALDESYAVFVEANGGYDGCWMCRALGVLLRGKLQRDHWHTGPNAGKPRGILCIYHNMKLGPTYTPEFLRAALAYVERGGAAG